MGIVISRVGTDHKGATAKLVFPKMARYSSITPKLLLSIETAKTGSLSFEIPGIDT